MVATSKSHQRRFSLAKFMVAKTQNVEIMGFGQG